MKLFTKLALLTLTTIALNAQTTMCYKENHSNMATIETVKLEGGVCKGEKNVKDMQKEGWISEDIKINNNNYIYIFKKATTADVNMQDLENRVIQRMRNENEEKQKLKKLKLTKSKIKNGKKLYEAKCALCHGPKGELEKYGKNAINTLNLKDFKTAIREYSTGQRSEKDKSGHNKVSPFAKQMVPYANMLTPNKINNIYVYFQSLKDLKPVEAKK